MSAAPTSSPRQSVAASASASASAGLANKFKALRGWLDEFDGKDSASEPSPDKLPRSPIIHHTYIWRSDSLPSLKSNEGAIRPAGHIDSPSNKENSRHIIKSKTNKKRAKGFASQRKLPAYLSQKSPNEKSQSRGRRRFRTAAEDADNASKQNALASSSPAVESSDSASNPTVSKKSLQKRDSPNFQDQQSVKTNDCVNHHGKTWSALNDASTSESSWHGKPIRAIEPEPIPICEWLTAINGEHKIPNLSLDTFAGVAHCCDINPITGSFIRPLIHPETYQCPEQLNDPQMIWRRDNMTSELEIVQEIRRREKLAARLSNVLNDSATSPSADYQWPKADCIIRPVQTSDFDEIARLFNVELGALSWPQIFSSRSFSSSDIESFFTFCAKWKHPFIVATTADDPLLDKSKWPANSTAAYEQYIAYKNQVDPNPQKKILGVAFVSKFKLGFLGTFSPATRHSGILRVVVHPDHRRRTIGSALLDRLLVSTSLFYRNQVDYEWHCDHRNGTYEHPVTRNTRQYARLYLDIWCESSNGPELAWRARMLAQFGLSQVAYLTGAGKSGHSQGAKWLDLSLWELQVQPCEDMADSMR